MDYFATAGKLYKFFKEITPYFFRYRDKGENRIWQKGAGSYVSQLDLNLSSKIERFLKKIADYRVISEETIKDAWPPQSKNFWLIDPLDGTHNFLMGLPIFGSMIALIEEGKVTLSVIFLPIEEVIATNGFYFAARTGGAWQYLNSQPMKISVSATNKIEEATLFFEGPYQRTFNLQSIVRLAKTAARIRSSLSFCWSGTRVASGKRLTQGADALVTYQNQPWDNLPACLLIEEAGGKVTDFAGHPWSVKNCNSLVLSNGYLHEKILLQLAEG